MKLTFQVGDLTIHRLVEMEVGIRPALEFFPNLTLDILAENREWLIPAALDELDRVRLCFQSHVVVTPHHTILVDACIGNGKERANRPLWHRKTDSTWMAALSAAGLTVEDIDFVLCTHMHVDHVGWNTRLENGQWIPTFPNARYLLSAKELNFWAQRNRDATIPHFEDSVLPILKFGQADLIQANFEVDDHVRIMPAPGHTIDHYAVALGLGRDQAVISGDLIHSPLQARYPELQMVLDHDPVMAAATRRAFLEKYCESGTVCCFAHFPSPSTGYIERWGGGFRCDYVE